MITHYKYILGDYGISHYWSFCSCFIHCYATIVYHYNYDVCVMTNWQHAVMNHVYSLSVTFNHNWSTTAFNMINHCWTNTLLIIVTHTDHSEAATIENHSWRWSTQPSAKPWWSINHQSTSLGHLFTKFAIGLPSIHPQVPINSPPSNMTIDSPCVPNSIKYSTNHGINHQLSIN